MEDELRPTSNNLADIIRWIKDGYCVTIHADGYYSRIYCNTLTECKGHISVNVASHIGLLDDGEWNWYIENAGCTPITTVPEVAPDRAVGFKLGY